MTETLAQKVRNAASRFEEVTVDDICEALNVRTYIEKKRVKQAIKDLKKQDELISLQPGRYRYQIKQTDFVLLERMWRAIRIKGSFTKRDIKKLSEATYPYVDYYFRFLEKAGFIARISGGRGYRTVLFALIDPDKAPLDHPKIRRRDRRK